MAQNDKRRKLTIIGSARLRMAERADLVQIDG